MDRTTDRILGKKSVPKKRQITVQLGLGLAPVFAALKEDEIDVTYGEYRFGKKSSLITTLYQNSVIDRYDSRDGYPWRIERIIFAHQKILGWQKRVKLILSREGYKTDIVSSETVLEHIMIGSVKVWVVLEDLKAIISGAETLEFPMLYNNKDPIRDLSDYILHVLPRVTVEEPLVVAEKPKRKPRVRKPCTKDQ